MAVHLIDIAKGLINIWNSVWHSRRHKILLVKHHGINLMSTRCFANDFFFKNSKMCTADIKIY